MFKIKTTIFVRISSNSTYSVDNTFDFNKFDTGL